MERSRLLGLILGLQAAGLALRIVGTAGELGVAVLVASLLQMVAFLLFGGWVWSMLDPPPLTVGSS